MIDYKNNVIVYQSICPSEKRGKMYYVFNLKQNMNDIMMRMVAAILGSRKGSGEAKSPVTDRLSW